MRGGRGAAYYDGPLSALRATSPKGGSEYHFTVQAKGMNSSPYFSIA